MSRKTCRRAGGPDRAIPAQQPKRAPARPPADSAGGVLEMKRKQTLAGLSNRKWGGSLVAAAGRFG
ncbi:MAG: hypothetical protein BGO16_01620 [Nitrobacter sp. 62-23]|nr:MAG: hypothetical protein BGO16_01620 [Nitrobacter sp. 62-23]